MKGYANHLWNGITTLEWSECLFSLLQDQNLLNELLKRKLIQLGTEEIYSKYDMLNIFNSVFKKGFIINSFTADTSINRSLKAEIISKSLEKQIEQLTIIIPTKNRYLYLESCLKSISVNYNRAEVGIMITDNSDVRQEIKAMKLFSNLNYSYIEKPISQVENFELALEKSMGKFVTMIGDDDGISDLLVDVAEYMERNKINALNSSHVNYYWPDVVSKNMINNFSGKVFLDEYKFQISKIDANIEREKCLLMGGTSLCNMPKMYYGIIKKEILEKVKADTGYYFPGPSPDMANAFSVSHYANNFVSFDAPLFIAGNSAKSAAGMGLAGKHIGDIKGHPQLPNDCHLNWTKEIPEYWSGPTIWAESVMQSINRSSFKELNSF